jgi:hypothetical protein
LHALAAEPEGMSKGALYQQVGANLRIGELERDWKREAIEYR